MLQTTTNVFLRKDDQLEKAINIHGDNIGSATKRPGYTKFGNTVSAGNAIRGVAEYRDISGGTQDLYTWANGGVLHGTGAAWTNIGSVAYGDALISSKTFLDQLFFCGANSANQYITTALVDSGGVSIGGNVTGAPKAKYVEIYRGRVILADVEVAGIRRASRFYESSVPDSTGSIITWPTTNYEEVYPDNGEALMGIHTNKSLNQLLLYKENSMHAYDLTQIRDIGNVGTSSHWSIATVGFITYHFKAGQGIYAYSGIQPQLVSRPIDKWIKGIQGSVVPFAANEEDKTYKLYVGQIIVDGETYENCEIRYAVPDNAWTIYSYAEAFTCYAPHTVSGVTRIYSGTTAGIIHQLARNIDGVYSDNGAPISAEFTTKAFDLQSPSAKKFVDKAVVFSTNTQNVQGRMRAPNKDWCSEFSLDQLEQYINLNPQDGRFIMFNFSESSTDQSFQIDGISFDPLITSEYTR